MARTSNPNTAAFKIAELARKEAKSKQENALARVRLAIADGKPSKTVAKHFASYVHLCAQELDATVKGGAASIGLPEKELPPSFAGHVISTMAETAHLGKAEGSTEAASDSIDETDETPSIADKAVTVGSIVSPAPFVPTPRNAPGGLNSDKPAVRNAA